MQCKHDILLNSQNTCTDIEQTEIDEALFRIKESVKKLKNDTINAITQKTEALTNNILSVADTAQMNLENALDSLHSDIEQYTAQFTVSFDSLNSFVNAEIGNTNNRVDNIIANNNDTQGNSELVDIRTGADGNVYSSAGSAV